MRSVITSLFLLLITVNSALAINLHSFKKKNIIVNGRPLTVFLADSSKKREQGLSNINLETLKANGVDGMLFVFDSDDEKTFQAWFMKFDLLLLALQNTTNNNTYKIYDRKVLNIGTTTKIKGKYILEIPLSNSLINGR